MAGVSQLKKPRVLLVPPPQLPIPSVKGGAVETLLTHLIRQNEQHGELQLICASIPDETAAAIAAQWQHTKMLYLPVPKSNLPYLPLVQLQKLQGIAPPWMPWYQELLFALKRQKIEADFVIAEGGNLLQLSAVSRHYGKQRCYAHLHGHTTPTPAVDAIYGGALAISEYIREEYLRSSAVSPQKVAVLHNCVDVTRFCPGPADAALRTRLGFAPQDFVVLYCGRLAEEKGIHKLLEAMTLVDDPSVKLLIVGSAFFAGAEQTPFSCQVEAAAAALGDRVRFTGYLENDKLPQYYRLADAVCVPTIVEEAAGLAAVEACACGRPVIATRSGGMPEYLAGSEAVLVERDDALPASLADAITALQHDPDRRTRMGLAGVQAAQRYSVEEFYRSFVKLIQEQERYL